MFIGTKKNLADKSVDSIVIHINDGLIMFMYPNAEEIPLGISSVLLGDISVEMVI